MGVSKQIKYEYSNIMSNKPANFADPNGSSHLGPYSPATKEQAASNEPGRSIRVYADGICDLFHAGHARQLQQCKNLFPNVYLLVGCCNDKLTHSRKGQTVNNEWERYENLSHCRYVDEVVKDAPWTLDEEFLSKHRIDFVAHDEAPYTTGQSEDSEDIYKWLKDSGRFCATQRTEGVSTSDLITRVVKDYDTYIKRQLSRGIPPNELNVNKLKAATIKTGIAYNKIKGEIKDKTNEIISSWRDRSHEWFEDFLRNYHSRNRRLEASHDSDGEDFQAHSPTGFFSLFRRSPSDDEGRSDDEGPSSSGRGVGHDGDGR